jgi:hypothetical protein
LGAPLWVSAEGDGAVSSKEMLMDFATSERYWRWMVSSSSLVCPSKQTPFKSLIVAILLACTTASGARAQVLMRGTDLLQVSDCPIETPYAPEPDHSRTTREQESLFFPMDGYLYQRIQFSGLSAPADLEIIWTPDNPYFPFQGQPAWVQPWPTKTAHLSVGQGTPQCFVNWFFSPGNVPGHIEIRARESLAGMKVSFSDRTWDHEGECPARQLCPVLMRYLHQCRSAPRSKSCDALIDMADHLTSRYQCRRAVDFEPVPAIWVCDELTASNVLDETMHLLAEEYMSDPERDPPAKRRARQ